MLSFLPVLFLAFSGFQTFPPLESYYHPVSTTSERAQSAFNEGMIALYAFNYDQAYRAFREAAEADPQLAMAHLGMAFAYEENDESEKAAEEVKIALTLLSGATESERGYVEAFATRFSETPENKHVKYERAMKKLSETYPDDPDCAVLYVESLMNLMGWSFWTAEKKPKSERTHQITELLENLLVQAPFHPGANHYYIHAIEGSSHPARGLMAASQLARFTTWGHLLHSASHIYLRVGEYEKAVRVNLNAMEADRAYLKAHPHEDRYVLRYIPHTLFYLTRSFMLLEKQKESEESAEILATYIAPFVADQPSLEENLWAPLEVDLYFSSWDRILKMAQPPLERKLQTAFWHFARAKAFLAQGDLAKAEEERKRFVVLPGLELAHIELEADFARAAGNREAWIAFLKEGVKQEDSLGFLGWYHQNRQTLGEALGAEGAYAEAEQSFREALERFPHALRSSQGLLRALRAQKKPTYWVEREILNQQ